MASWVRDLFARANKEVLSIIFIDELVIMYLCMGSDAGIYGCDQNFNFDLGRYMSTLSSLMPESKDKNYIFDPGRVSKLKDLV